MSKRSQIIALRVPDRLEPYYDGRKGKGYFLLPVPAPRQAKFRSGTLARSDRVDAKGCDAASFRFQCRRHGMRKHGMEYPGRCGKHRTTDYLEILTTS